jgi:hypothetical protein
MPPTSSNTSILTLFVDPTAMRQRVSVDLPAWMVASLDAEAARLGITLQSVIKAWIAERLDRHAS